MNNTIIKPHETHTVFIELHISAKEELTTCKNESDASVGNFREDNVYVSWPEGVACSVI